MRIIVHVLVDAKKGKEEKISVSDGDTGCRVFSQRLACDFSPHFWIAYRAVSVNFAQTWLDAFPARPRNCITDQHIQCTLHTNFFFFFFLALKQITVKILSAIPYVLFTLLLNFEVATPPSQLIQSHSDITPTRDPPKRLAYSMTVPSNKPHSALIEGTYKPLLCRVCVN